MLFLALFLFSSCIYLLIGFIFLKRKSKYEERIKKFLPNNVLTEKKNEQKKTRISLSNKFFLWVIDFLKDKKVVLKWSKRIEESGLNWKPEVFFVYRSILIIGPFLLGFVLKQSFLIGVIFSLFGFILPIGYLKNKKKQRLKRGVQQLPQTLGTMATAMKAGFSFIQAMQLVGKEIPDPIGTEFLKTIKKINLGISMEEAFNEMLERFPNKDLEMIVTALLIQRSTGGNLADLLENMQTTITERIKMKEELNALTAQGKMSAWVISLLPVGLGLLLNLMNPTYFSPLLQHPLGIAMLIMGLISGVIGWLIIRKIVDVEV